MTSKKIHCYMRDSACGQVIAENTKIFWSCFNPKKAGGQSDPPWGFAKTVLLREGVKLWFFVTFNIIILS